MNSLPFSGMSSTFYKRICVFCIRIFSLSSCEMSWYTFLFLFCRQRYYSRCCWCPKGAFHFRADLPRSSCWELHALEAAVPGEPAIPAPTASTATGYSWWVNTPLPQPSVVSRLCTVILRSGCCTVSHSFYTELNSSLVPGAAV